MITQQFFFKINLNRFGEMKLQQEKENKTFLRSVLFFAAGTLLCFGAALYFNSLLAKKAENREKFLQDAENKLATYQKSTDNLTSTDLDLLAKTFNDRIFWARKLVSLAREIDGKMAITQFTFKNGVLSLYGVTSIDKNQREFDLIDQFIAKLKANEEINRDFPEIRYAKANRDKVKDTDILRFQIDCFGKEAKTEEGGAQ